MKRDIVTSAVRSYARNHGECARGFFFARARSFRAAEAALLAGLIAGSAVLAVSARAEHAPADRTGTVTLRGYLIDNECAAHNRDTLATFVSTHVKECACRPECRSAGYSLWTTSGTVVFTADSTPKVTVFLADTWSLLQVEVTGTYVGKKLRLRTIRNRRDLKFGSHAVRFR